MDSTLLSLLVLGVAVGLTTAATIAPPAPVTTAAAVNTTAVDDCVDTVDDCWSKPDSDCFGIYEPWSRAHCPLRCGFCPGKLPPCEDKLDYCQQFEASTCVDETYAVWARTNCRKHCNLCAVPTRPETTPSSGVTDSTNAGGPTDTTQSGGQTATPKAPNSSGPAAIPGTVASGKQESLLIQGPASSVPGTCQFNGNTYQEGARWKEGCEWDCMCLSASQNRVLCTEQCNRWDLADSFTACRLVREGSDCCQRLECD